MFGLRIIKVAGASMAPVLKNGDFVVAKLRVNAQELEDGDVVVFEHKRLGTIVKAVGAKTPEGDRPLFGLSDYSTSEINLGLIGRDSIVSKAIWHIGRSGLKKITPLVAFAATP